MIYISVLISTLCLPVDHSSFYNLKKDLQSLFAVVSIQAPITKRTSISVRVPLSFLNLWIEETGQDKRKQKRYAVVVPNAVCFLQLSVCRSFRLETYQERYIGLKVSVNGNHISFPFTQDTFSLPSSAEPLIRHYICLCFWNLVGNNFNSNKQKKKARYLGMEYWWNVHRKIIKSYKFFEESEFQNYFCVLCVIHVIFLNVLMA